MADAMKQEPPSKFPLLAGEGFWPSQATTPQHGSKLLLLLKLPRQSALEAYGMAERHCHEHCGRCRPYPPELLHITVQCLGVFAEPPKRIINLARGAAARID